jgi:hypothetical protein
VALLLDARLDQRHELIFLGKHFEKVENKWNVVESASRVFYLKDLKFMRAMTNRRTVPE